MHIRLVTLRVREGRFDRVLRLTEEVVMPTAERQEGFAAFVLMSDRETNKIASITMWQTEADMIASERGEFLQEQFSRVITLLAGPPQIEHYQVDSIS